jgi:hypothetical protein
LHGPDSRPCEWRQRCLAQRDAIVKMIERTFLWGDVRPGDMFISRLQVNNRQPYTRFVISVNIRKAEGLIDIIFLVMNYGECHSETHLVRAIFHPKNDILFRAANIACYDAFKSGMIIYE